jgi:hypothetical protein
MKSSLIVHASGKLNPSAWKAPSTSVRAGRADRETLGRYACVQPSEPAGAFRFPIDLPAAISNVMDFAPIACRQWSTNTNEKVPRDILFAMDRSVSLTPRATSLAASPLYVIPLRTSSALTIRRASFSQFMGHNIAQTKYSEIHIPYHELTIPYMRFPRNDMPKQGRGLSFGFYTNQDKSKLIRSRSSYV